MKDEHQVRIEALKLTQVLGGIESLPQRIKFAHQIEQYILNGHSGEAAVVRIAPAEVPGTEGKGPPKGRTKRASTVPADAGEASDIEQEGEADLESLQGRPSARVKGVEV